LKKDKNLEEKILNQEKELLQLKKDHELFK
jgi:hypothetical protein